MTQTQNVMVERLLKVFGMPDRTPDVPGFLAEYAKLTAGCGPGAQERAATRLIRDGGRHWPTPKAVLDALSEAVAAMAGEAAAKSAAAPKQLMPWEIAAREGTAWARQYMAASAFAAEARAEGWGRELELYAASFARQRLQAGGALPGLQDYRPPADVIADYRRYGVRREARGLPVRSIAPTQAEAAPAARLPDVSRDAWETRYGAGS